MVGVYFHADDRKFAAVNGHRGPYRPDGFGKDNGGAAMQSPIRLARPLVDRHARRDPIIAIAGKFDADKAGHAIPAAVGHRIQIKRIIKPDFCHSLQLTGQDLIAT